MIREKDEYIQLPPLRRDTDLEVLIALWEYMKMPEESQKVVLSAMEEINNTDSGEDVPSPEDYRKLPSESVMEFEKSMKNMIGNLIIESCNLVCWVYYNKCIQGWTLEQMVNRKKDAEKFIIVKDILFDEYMDMPDENNNHVKPS